MRRKVFSTLRASLLTIPAVHVQWVVTDPGNPAQGIANNVSEIAETSEMAQNAISTFKEAPKIYEQSRKYYDTLRSVNSLIGGGLEVKESMLMFLKVSESYVMNYGKMLTDGNYTQRELEVITFGYNNVMKRSSTSVAGLKDIINPADMSMIGRERPGPIERVYHEMRHHETLVSYHARRNLRVFYLRAGEKGEIKQVLRFYGEDGRYW